jgi:hypothetical protein
LGNHAIFIEAIRGEALNVGTSWAEIVTALAVMGIITFLLLV